MKLLYQINKVLLVIAALCFIFIVIPGWKLSKPGKSDHTVLYDKNDCNGKLVIVEQGRTIYVRSKESTAGAYAVLKYQTAEFHPAPVAKMDIE
jgi:hypothetical protein